MGPIQLALTIFKVYSLFWFMKQVEQFRQYKKVYQKA